MNTIRICPKWETCPLIECQPTHGLCHADGKTKRRITNLAKLIVVNKPHLDAERSRQIAEADLGMRRYDKRRKGARGYWRTKAA